MSRPWAVLALLFFVRAAMAFQFQSVGALGPAMMQGYGFAAADIGALVALYFAPGVALALPGGIVTRLIGDRRVVAIGLLFMTVGGAGMAASDTWAIQFAGRFASGVGGALLNVAMAKMVADAFAGRALATPMALFINAWPVGIALALVTLPALSGGDPHIGLFATAVVVGAALVAFIALCPAQTTTSTFVATGAGATPKGRALLVTIAAGTVWGLYNASLNLLFAFAPLMLAERGWSLGAASAATGLIVWTAALAVPLGGVVADRMRRPHLLLYGAFIAQALAIVVAARTDHTLAAFAVVGFVSGLPAGAAMSLPARVLTPETRAAGMGVFYTLYYALVVAAPPIGGRAAEWAGRASAALDLGAATAIGACVFVLASVMLARPARVWLRVLRSATASPRPA